MNNETEITGELKVRLEKGVQGSRTVEELLALRISTPLDSSFNVLLRRYHAEQIVFLSSAEKRRYAISAIDADGVDIKRLDANEPQRLSFVQAENLIKQVREQGAFEFATLNHTAAVRNTVLQAEPLALTADQKRVVFLADVDARVQNFCALLATMKRENRFYKPAMLLCVLDGIASGALSSNQITFDWIAPRFIALMKSLGVLVTEQQAAQPFYHLSNDLFWLHSVNNLNDLMKDGGDGPGAARNKIKYALLKDTYWNLLQAPAAHIAIRHQLETMIMPNPDQLLSAAETAIKDTGFQHAQGLVRRFLGALAAKPFIILTGNSGTGKTQLAKLSADWLSPTASAQNVDPFSPGGTIESDRIKYFIHNADVHSVEFWNSNQKDEAIKVSLPREMIREWADTMFSRHFTQETPARTIREAVVAQSRFSSQLHSFETHLKSAALALLKAQPTLKGGFVPGPARCSVVPIGADWTDNRNVLGFVNHLRLTEDGKPLYESTPILELILRAAKDGLRPYFLILDEMNLSHVERYFADFLSAMESGRPIPLHTSATPLKSPQGTDVPAELVLPDNLFITGTVNVDETTYMFSPKVLDRANVIEFRVNQEDAAAFLAAGAGGVGDIATAPAGAAQAFLALSRKARQKPVPDLVLHTDAALADKRKALSESLVELFGIMHKHRMEFGYRTMHEVLRYAGVDYELAADRATWSWAACLDVQILQKILPKLHGSKKRIEQLLVDLAVFCETGAAPAGDGVFKASSTAKIVYRESYAKLADMIEIVRRDQFVSFI